jgi:hypothetical protein
MAREIYKVLVFEWTDDDMVKDLNKLANEGWRIIHSHVDDDTLVVIMESL